ncbi:MAG: FtsQ-type POTRA domain-containing protein [Patescibacteria group bacterium]|nr:FtsQ-type POTRA domain-containing protein [Patescibacteria group bacterium]
MIKKRKKKGSFKKFVFLGLFFCLLGALAYFLIWSPFFWVKEIKISAKKKPMHYSFTEIEEIANGVLGNKIFYFIPIKSIILAPTEEIKKNILERFPEIKSVNVSKKAPSILKIEIEERKGVGIWCNYRDEIAASQTPRNDTLLSLRAKRSNPGEENEIAASQTPRNNERERIPRNDEDGDYTKREIKDCFKIDKDGVIFRESPLISGNLVLNIYNAKNNSAKIRDKVIPPKVMSFILTAQKELSKIKIAKKIFPAVVSFEFVSIEELKANTLQGWQIYFNPAVPANLQIETLKTVLDNETKNDLSSLEYVDLRIEGRVYYK